MNISLKKTMPLADFGNGKSLSWNFTITCNGLVPDMKGAVSKQTIHRLYAFIDGCKACRIDEIWVEEKYRRRGIGSWMLSQLFNYYQENRPYVLKGIIYPEKGVSTINETTAYKFWLSTGAQIKNDNSFTMEAQCLANKAVELSRGEFDLATANTELENKLKECQKSLVGYEDSLKNAQERNVQLMSRTLMQKGNDFFCSLLHQIVYLFIAPIAKLINIVRYCLNKRYK